MNIQYLKVDENHELRIERIGNLEGETIIFLHGGPGNGYTESDKDFFDFEKHNVIFFDQRGAGKSRFTGDVLKNNTTDYLVEDINKILNHFNITEKVCLFGGSWGSTLALVFAIRYSEKVKKMILRGIYIPCELKKDFLLGAEDAYLFPDEWEKLLSKVPENRHDDVCTFFLEKLTSTKGNEQWQWAYDFTLFESILARLDPDIKEIERNIKADKNLINSAIIEASSISNHCYIPLNYIFDNIVEIEDIPTKIVHGRYDAICPALDAWKLHKKLKNSTIEFPLAGHSPEDKELNKALIKSMKSIF